MSESEKNELYEPPYPKPLKASEKRSLYRLYKRGRKSWIHTLYEGSFKNKFSIVKLPGFKIFMPKVPADVNRILTNDYPVFPKSKLIHEALKPLLGNSIFTTNGEVWERQRRMINPAFASAGLKKVFPLMLDAVKAMKGRLDQLGDGEEIRIDLEMTHVTADIIMRTILSMPIEEDEALEIFEWFDEFQEKASRVSALGAFRLPSWILPWDYYLWKKRGAQIREVIGKIIKRRYAEFTEKEGATEYGDILEALMHARDEETDSKFTELELVDQVVVLFFAGHETSASALSWAVYILANQQTLADSLASEAEASYKDLDSVEFTQVHKLKRCRDVFRETLRLYPPVAFFGRSSKKEQEVAGKTVEEGASIMISAYMVHRHQDVWKDPNAFKPERFSEGENKKCPGSYFPFSSGPRVCIGAAFAQQEALIILATLMRHYEFSTVPSHTPDPASRITLRSLNGILLKMKRRTSIPDDAEQAVAADSEDSPASCPFSG